MNAPLVNLHIVGVQKAGTSALAHFLSQHAGACVVEGKEAHVFDQPDFNVQDKTAYANRRYAKKLAHYQNEEIICDATPITICNKAFLRDCFNYNPKAKFILLLRNPVERAVSHFYMSKQRGREPYNMLLSFIRERSRLKACDGPNAWASRSSWRDQSYLQRGRYRKQINDLYEIVPKEQCLILNQEVLLAHHDDTLKEVFKFLNLPYQDIKAEQVFNSDIEEKDKTELFARIYAYLYFLLKGEYPY